MRSFLKRVSILVALVTAAWALMPSPSSAQIPIPGFRKPSPSPSPAADPTPTAQPTPTPDPTVAPTANPTPTSTAKPKSTSTPRPKASPKPAKKGSSSSRPSAPKSSSSARRAARAQPVQRSLGPTSSPSYSRELTTWLTREKSPARTTTRLLELMRVAGRNLDSSRDLSRTFGRFPVLGYVWYQDDYGAPRYLPSYHPHEGTDLFAVSGTPVVASADGYIWKIANGGTSGNAIWLMTPSGRYYFYGHLSALARGITPGKRVSLGNVIGFVGDTGVAKGTYPHVHFEVHPNGTTDSVNPKGILDAWLTAAEDRLMSALGAVRAEVPTHGGANWGSLMDLLADSNASPPTLWTAGFGMSGATVALADLALAGPLSEHDWTSLEVPVVGDGPSGSPSAVVSAYEPLGLLLAALDPVRTGD